MQQETEALRLPLASGKCDTPAIQKESSIKRVSLIEEALVWQSFFFVLRLINIRIITAMCCSARRNERNSTTGCYY
jgi:hypothetical protein